MSSGKSWIGGVFSGKLAAHTCSCNVYAMLSLKMLQVIRTKCYGANCNLQTFSYQNREAYVCICYS